MSVHPEELPADRSRPLYMVAGFLSAAAIFAGIVALFYYPDGSAPLRSSSRSSGPA